MKDLPNPEEIQKKLSEYLKKEFGENVIHVQKPVRQGSSEDSPSTKPIDKKLNFNLKPLDLEKYLNSYVIGQEDACEVLGTKICTHFNRMRMEAEEPISERIQGNIKTNILMIGPTGVGKTYIIKLIADYIGVPFVKGDATKFTETGYVGGDVEDLVRELYYKSDRDIELAEMGIIYLDEIDKIASSGSMMGPDVSRTGVQRNLLKLMEESEVDIRVPHDLASQMEAMMKAQQSGKVDRQKINTRNILFILSGAFSGLEEIISRRLNMKSIGFQADIKTKKDAFPTEILKQVRNDDIVKYGFEYEFVGRIPIVTILNDLTEEALYQILRNENSSIIRGKQKDFKAYGIQLNFEDPALVQIASKAILERTGARALTGVIEKALIGFEKYLPSTNIHHLTITESIIEDPKMELHKLLNEEAFSRFVDYFQSEHSIALHFDGESMDWIRSKAEEQKRPIESLCREIFNNYEYGLKLIGSFSLQVTKELAQEPKRYLDDLIKHAYEKEKH